MKQFTGQRTLEESKEKMSEFGWEYYESNFQNRMVKQFSDIGVVDVCIRSFGKFFAYNDSNVCLGSERSSELDGTEWYDEILDILYTS
jgi:hypothetical protein